MEDFKTLRKKGFKYVCGVDEAGRGPLAGPMSLSFFVVPIDHYKKIMVPLLKNGLNDSKKLSEDKREELFVKIISIVSPRQPNTSSQRKLGPRKEDPESSLGRRFCGIYSYNSMIAAKQIDKYGITKSYKILINRILKKVPKKTFFLLDGSIKFPENIPHKVIIGGDGIEPTIMAASIVSKVRRDRRMKKLAKQHPEYGFDVHKGYGTKLHMDCIKKCGICDIHRKSFCRAFTKKH